MVTIHIAPKYHKTTCPHCNKEIKAIIIKHSGSFSTFLTENAERREDIQFLGCPNCRSVMWIEQTKML